MNYEITSKWRGKCLVTKEEVGPIPANTLVFCFEEPLHITSGPTPRDDAAFLFAISEKTLNEIHSLLPYCCEIVRRKDRLVTCM